MLLNNGAEQDNGRWAQRPNDLRSQKAQELQSNIATFMYSSHSVGDLAKLRELAHDIETIEWGTLDVRHPKFDYLADDPDIQMDDCDEDLDQGDFDVINVHSLSTKSNNLKSIISQNRPGVVQMPHPQHQQNII